MLFIEFDNVSRYYPMKSGNVTALDRISFGVQKGEFLALTGPSGCGKSTLLHILGGLDCPTQGQVYVNGENLYTRSARGLAEYRRNTVGIIYQFYNLVPELTAEENLCLPAVLDHRKADRKRVDEILKFLNMEDRRHHYPEQLSGGQQQKTRMERVSGIRP